MRHGFWMTGVRIRLAAAMIFALHWLCLPALAAESADPTEKAIYQFDPVQSRFTVRAFTGGALGMFGHDHTIAVRDFIGKVEMGPEGFDPLRLEMTVASESLTVIDRINEEDRQKIEVQMRQNVLETGRFPAIRFRSTKIERLAGEDGNYDVRLWGDLELHGVTHRIAIDGRVTVEDGLLRASGEFPLRQKPFDIEPVTLFGGLVKVENKLNVTFDIVARPQGQ
ncbi:hypothetical protein DESUT3_10860 [Desulfuromonas versatilis]|uniref:Lipid/polyisoprenoid-binding YceI-like domain-containing protein n=1 Tax=Desulfuromonas versatilis TaxID=2802975 RepID=A0ABN6DVF8_9BACT|nr:YceI family protein [Desulfuromonas versatilis]BCR04017.1 hypothetical protein DESUT3_10860 [Desulfuromonas versatilis]